MTKKQMDDMAADYDFSEGERGKFYRPDSVLSVVDGASVKAGLGGRAPVTYTATMSTLLSRITVRAEQMHGQPCIRGMRIRVSDVLEMLAGGMSYDEILADYPYLERDDILAALAYAAQEMKHPIVTAAQ